MTQINFCDMCGEKINQRAYDFVLDSYDFCRDCKKEVIQFIERKSKEKKTK